MPAPELDSRAQEKYELWRLFLSAAEESFLVRKIHPFDLYALFSTAEGSWKKKIPLTAYSGQAGDIYLVDGVAYLETTATMPRTSAGKTMMEEPYLKQQEVCHSTPQS